MVDLVLGVDGSLKAEHGTGRMMAGYVRRQYGDELYDVMREVKRLCDPQGVLNPGVIVSDDPEAHTRDFKETATVEEEVDRCVECGYCEPVCPSRDLTTTPRQRIVLRREMQRARAAGDLALLRELESEYAYDAVETCAVDGMCQVACPVSINTGDLMKRLRAEHNDGRLAARGGRSPHGTGRRHRVASLALTADQGPARPGGAAPEPVGPQADRPGHPPAVVARPARRRPAPRCAGPWPVGCRTAPHHDRAPRGRLLHGLRQRHVRAERGRPASGRRSSPV